MNWHNLNPKILPGPIWVFIIVTFSCYFIGAAILLNSSVNSSYASIDIWKALKILSVSIIFVVIGSSNRMTKFDVVISETLIMGLTTALVITASTLVLLYEMPIESANYGFELLQERLSSSRKLEGLRHVFHSLYTLLSFIAIPAVALYCYFNRPRWLMFAIPISVLYLALYCAKGSIILLIVPLLFGTLKKKDIKSAIGFSMIALAYIIISFSLWYPSNKEMPITVESSLTSAPNGVINAFVRSFDRTFLIQAESAFDWVEYFRVARNQKYYLGTSIPLIGSILNFPQQRSRPSSEVMKYHLPDKNRLTGDSTCHFALDAYVNFGYLGVACYGLLIGFILTALHSASNQILSVFSYCYAIWLTLGDLPSLLTMGGLGIVLIFGFISQNNFK